VPGEQSPGFLKLREGKRHLKSGVSLSWKDCPLCGGPNQCSVAEGVEKMCWCVTEKFPQEVFNRIPEEYEGTQCICIHCLNEIREGLRKEDEFL
jgi:hypothetical protein